MVRRLFPFTVNTKKRLVKAPKIYVRDSGILASLLDLNSYDHLYSHPTFGACWEGYAIENILSVLEPKSSFGFFRTHAGEEIDLVLEVKGRRIGFEFRTSSSPTLSQKSWAACEILNLDAFYVVTPDADHYQIGPDNAWVTNLAFFLKNLRALPGWELKR